MSTNAMRKGFDRLKRLYGRRIGGPILIGVIGRNILLEEIGCDLCSLLTFCRHRAMT